MRKLIIPLVAAAVLASCSVADKEASYNVVPKPLEIALAENGAFRLDANTKIAFPAGDENMERNARFLSDYVAQACGYNLSTTSDKAENAITLALNDEIENEEGYVIIVSADGVLVEGKTPQAVFYGVQTLRKSLPANSKDAAILLPAATIKDQPRFAYRGMHLDVCRHFFPVEFVKKYIDIMALHNINTFHWHLTEDQGWRIAIDKYPKLMEIGAWRDSTVVGYLGSGEYDNVRHGGYYTKEEMRDVVAYAQERYINIIPEVDLPGHMLAALAAYPEFGCTGGPYTVSPDWGIFEDVLCVGNEKTMQFLEDVCAEVIDIFPSKYIHIGGDEVPTTRWKGCPICQAKIKELGLKADGKHSVEYQLQNYCTNRIERFLNAHGRQIIGWDEILNGDLAPEAIVMSGNSYAGGVRAAQMNHKVVMAPNTTYYFDYYQTPDNEDEPLSIGGCITVEQVYNSDPTSELNEEQAANVWGIQANMWTEYVPTTEHVEYMVLPRMAALAEVQWCEKDKKDYDDFTARLVNLMNIYEREGYNYAKHVYDIKYDFTPDVEKQAVVVTLTTIDDAPVYYTTDGTEPTENSAEYTGPVEIRENSLFKALAFRNGEKSKLVEKNINFNKATVKPVTLTTCEPYPNYTYKGACMLTDGMIGTENFASGAWLGFVGTEVTAIVDLGEEIEIKHLGARALTHLDAWIMAPVKVCYAVSNDNESFKEVYSKDLEIETDYQKREIVDYAIDIEPTTARYVKLTFMRSPALPKGHAAAGQNPFLFIDEIIIK